MKITKIFLFIGVFVALLSATSSHAQTFNFNLKTFVTFDKPVQVPGATLQPNVKYMFSRMAPEAGLNHVIVVQTANDKHVVATFHATSDQHLDAPGKTEFTFYETAPGYARAIREWTYPDRSTGFEFVYSKHQMGEITAHLINGNEVITQTAQIQTSAPETSEIPAAQEATVPATTQNDTSDLDREKPSAVTSEDSASDQNSNETANTQVAENSSPAPSELPRTAGELPLLLVAGFSAIALRKSIRSSRN